MGKLLRDSLIGAIGALSLMIAQGGDSGYDHGAVLDGPDTTSGGNGAVTIAILGLTFKDSPSRTSARNDKKIRVPQLESLFEPRPKFGMYWRSSPAGIGFKIELQPDHDRGSLPCPPPVPHRLI